MVLYSIDVEPKIAEASHRSPLTIYFYSLCVPVSVAAAAARYSFSPQHNENMCKHD